MNAILNKLKLLVLQNRKKILFLIAVILGILILAAGFYQLLKFWERSEIEKTVVFFRDLMLSLVEGATMIIVLLLLILMIRWLVRKPKGILVLPFQIASKQEAKSELQYDGNSISNIFQKEMLQIIVLHQNNQKLEEEIKIRMLKKEETTSQTIQDIVKSTAGEPTIDNDKSGDRNNLPETSSAVSSNTEKINSDSMRGGNNISALNISYNRESLTDGLNISVGGNTFSLGKLLLSVKQLWNNREPEVTISGSIQQYGTLTSLIIRYERTNDRTLFFEVSDHLPNQEGLPAFITDCVFKFLHNNPKIWEIANCHTPQFKTCDSLKSFTNALFNFREYEFNSLGDQIEVARKECLNTARIENMNINLFGLSYDLALIHYNKQDFANAEALFQCALDIQRNLEASPISDKKTSEYIKTTINHSLCGLGNALASQGKDLEAENIYLKAIKNCPTDIINYYNLSLVLKKGNQTDDLMEIIHRATDLNLIDNTENKIAIWYEDLGMYKEAIAEYKTILEKDPSNIRVCRRIGALYAGDDRGAAIEYYKKAINISDKTKTDDKYVSGIYNDLAIVLADNKENKDAGDAYLTAIKLDPDSAIFHNNLGSLHSNLQDTESAIREYKTACRLDPDFILSHRNLGIEYARKKLMNEAIMEYKKALMLAPKDINLHFECGNLYSNFDLFEDAVREYQEAIALSAGNPNPAFYVNLGYVYRTLKRDDEAIAAFNQAYAINSQYTGVFNGIGGIHRRAKRFNEAIEAYKKAIAGGNKHPLTMISLAICYRALGMNAEYLQYKEEALALADHNKWSENDEYNHACFEALLMNTDEALRLLKKVIKKEQQTLFYIYNDIDFDFIRDDPGFKKLFEK
jgi:tetratricopeptide (TPR) repeat protein